jgi:hypothetical protein
LNEQSAASQLHEHVIDGKVALKPYGLNDRSFASDWQPLKGQAIQAMRSKESSEGATMLTAGFVSSAPHWPAVCFGHRCSCAIWFRKVRPEGTPGTCDRRSHRARIE